MCTNGHPVAPCKKHRREHIVFEIFEALILSCVQKLVRMSSSWQGGTKLQNRVVTAVVSNENHSSNWHNEVIHAYCYYDWSCLALTEHSNGRTDDIGPLLL
jgi:hypothetical protein